MADNSGWDISDSAEVTFSESMESTATSTVTGSSYGYSGQYSRTTIDSPSSYVPTQQEFQFVNVPATSASGTATSPTGKDGVHTSPDLWPFRPYDRPQIGARVHTRVVAWLLGQGLTRSV